MTLRHFGWIEGGSLLVLLFVAMPLRYLGGIDEGVRFVGMAHGVLFMIFMAWVLFAAWSNKWSIEKVAGATMASVIPFGPFVADLAE